MTVRWSVVVSRCVLCVGAQSDSGSVAVSRCVLCVGAQSDSEVVSGGQSACPVCRSSE